MSKNMTPATSHNNDKGCKHSKAGSVISHEPCLFRDIFAEMLQSDSPFANAYRQHVDRTALSKTSMTTWHKNTELCVDVKTYLQRDSIPKLDKDYRGVIRRDDVNHFTFVECERSAPAKRTVRVKNGIYTTVTRSDDGSYRPNLKPVRITSGFDVVAYVNTVKAELLTSLLGLVEGV